MIAGRVKGPALEGLRDDATDQWRYDENGRDCQIRRSWLLKKAEYTRKVSESISGWVGRKKGATKLLAAQEGF